MAEDNGSVEFLPGFTNFLGSKPGAVLENKEYVLTFFGVLLNGKKSAIVSQGFESCYDWSDVMNILIEALDQFEDISSAEEVSTLHLTWWLMTYSGWGLLSTLLPRQQHVKFSRMLRQIKQNWTQYYEGEFFEEGCWDILLQDIHLEDIVPQFQVTISHGDFGGQVGRKKWLDLSFISSWNMSVRFTIEKKRCETNLVNIAAAAVGKHIEDEDTIQQLDIPVTLRSPVTKMRRDQRWLTSKTNL